MEVVLPGAQERRLVIAIDYGTTYTGVAYATPAGSRAYLNEIDILDNWGGKMGNHDRIPSVISYSRASDAQEEQWGASLSPKAVAMMHTKLELDLHDTSGELDFILDALKGMRNLHFQYVREAGSLPQYTWKGPEQIVEDYLTKVFDSFFKFLVEISDTFPEELRAIMPVHVVVTIPAEWSYRAKNSTFRALTRAGFNKDAFPKLTEMLLVSEPEAAAIYTARYLKELDGASFLKKGECFALCDAGGGTVDVVSYRVKELEPSFELEAVTFPTDLAFKEWLRKLLGDQNYRRLDQTQLAHQISSHNSEGQQMRELMKEFNILKRKFNKDHRDMKMELPSPLDNLNMDTRVVGGLITITNADMRSFFDPCVDRIIELIQGHIGQVDRLRNRLRNIFLVGGFAESEYLQEEIRYSLRLRNIELRRPDKSWTAVVRGATIFGIEKPASKTLSSMKACPRSYGVSVSESFSEVKHQSKDITIDPLTGKPMAKEQLMWLIKKGDLILSNEPKEVKKQFTKQFPDENQRNGQMPIYAYDDDDLPERLSNSENELTLVHTLEYDLMDIPLEEFARQQHSVNNVPFYAASLTFTMRLDGQRLRVELSWKDRTLCSASIDYP